MSELESILTFFCHQIESRSPQTGQLIFPVCYRCAGLYLGMFGSFAGILVSGRRQRAFPKPAGVIILASLSIPFLIDGWANTLGIWESPGWLRAATGCLTGLTIPYLLLPLKHLEITIARSRSIFTSSSESIFTFSLIAVLFVLLVDFKSVAVFYALKISVLIGAASFYWNAGLAVYRMLRESDSKKRKHILVTH